MDAVRLFSGLFSGHDAARFGHPLMHRSENQPVIPAETFSATHRLQKKKWKQEFFDQCPASGAEPNLAATIATTIRRECGLVGGITHNAPRLAYLDVTVYEGRNSSFHIVHGAPTLRVTLQLPWVH